MVTLPNEITILGAGLSGLTAAIGLARAGKRVTVLEKRSLKSDSGLGIQITPNGSAVLRALGIWPGSSATIANVVEMVCYRTGVRQLRLPLGGGAKGHQPHLLFHRNDLIERMQKLAFAAGVKLTFETEVKTIETFNDRVDCILKNGQVHRTPYLIGADGLHSQTQRMLNNGGAARRGHYVAWRALIDLPEKEANQDNHVCLIHAPKRHVVTYPLRDSKMQNMVAIKKLRRARPVRHLQASHKQELFKEFANLTACHTMFDRCHDITVWVLPDSKLSDIWYNGRAVIIGDALHPMLPFLAQGGNMALEDGWCLTQLLLSSDSIASAHQLFRDRREVRIRRVLRAVDGQGWLNHLGSWVDIPRSIVLRSLGSVYPPFFTHRLNWLFDHDVTLPP